MEKLKIPSWVAKHLFRLSILMDFTTLALFLHIGALMLINFSDDTPYDVRACANNGTGACERFISPVPMRSNYTFAVCNRAHVNTTLQPNASFSDATCTRDSTNSLEGFNRTFDAYYFNDCLVTQESSTQFESSPQGGWVGGGGGDTSGGRVPSCCFS
jgi:hypothetical protein